MKKILALMATACATAGCLAACSSNVSTSTNKTVVSSEKKLKVVTTIFPEYDWVKQILGDKADRAEVTNLINSGVDLHSYQPTAQDILKIGEADVFIYVGGESDKWVEGALKSANNKKIVAINLMETLGKENVKEEEVVEGMQEDDHDHDKDSEKSGDHDHDKEHNHEEETEYDEHVWLSLKKAGFLCDSIATALEKADPDNASTYSANVASYKEKLNKLDGEYKRAVDAASTKTLVFGDRFPFRYMVDDYGLKYYAAFVGCSAETEASFETITFLAKKVDELGLKNVLTIEGTTHKIAETIIQNTKEKNQKILTLDSLQSATAEDAKNGTTYLSVMEKNLEMLKEALK